MPPHNPCHWRSVHNSGKSTETIKLEHVRFWNSMRKVGVLFTLNLNTKQCYMLVWKIYIFLISQWESIECSFVLPLKPCVHTADFCQDPKHKHERRMLKSEFIHCMCNILPFSIQKVILKHCNILNPEPNYLVNKTRQNQFMRWFWSGCHIGWPWWFSLYKFSI